MKQLYLVIGMIFISASYNMYAYQVSFQDFTAALSKYQRTRNINDKSSALNIYEMLSAQDQSRAQKELQNANVMLTTEKSELEKAELWNNFVEYYTNWSQNWSVPNLGEFKQRTVDTIKRMLDAYNRLDDSQKPHAISLIQGLLHEFPAGSHQFQYTDSVLAEFHQNRMNETQASMGIMRNLQEELSKKSRQLSPEEVHYKTLSEENKSLKEEIPSLQNQLIAISQKLALAQQPETAQAIEQENKDLSQQLLALRKEVADLEQQLKQKTTKRKK